MASKECKIPDFYTYFADPALIKAYYIPTEKLPLTEEQKKLAMSPHRIPERESGVKQPITPETEAYLRQTEYMYNTEKGMPNHPTPSPPSTIKFDESWPSTEHPSTLGSNVTKSSIGRENRSPETDDSVISKYLRRFRNDPPLRREERKAPSLHEFWWGSNRSKPNSISTNKTADEISKSSTTNSSAKATDNNSSDRNFEISSDSTPKSHVSSSKAGKRINFEPTTPKTKALVDRTNQLLSNSELTGTSGSPPAVSTDGLGSTDGSSGSRGMVYHSTPEEEAVRPAFHRNMTGANHRRVEHRPVHSLNPENDILYQWRLKRRLEQAQERVKAAEHQAAVSQSNVYSDLNQAARGMSRPFVYRRTPGVAGVVSSVPVPLSSPQETSQQKIAATTPTRSESELIRSVKTTVIERVVQTDAEIVQTATQTTPTVDPISACTGSVTAIPTGILRDRISAAASPTMSCSHQCFMSYDRQQCCRACDRHHTASQQHRVRCDRQSPARQQCCLKHDRHTSQSKCCDGCKHLTSAVMSTNANNNCLTELSSDEENTDRDIVSSDSQELSTPTRRKGALGVPPIPKAKVATTDEPKATPVSQAISEVCRQRLFDTSISPDVTLVDAIRESPVSSDAAAAALEQSDGEFSDDDLLAALRQKRLQIVNRMREVDTRLSEVAMEPL